MSKGTKSTVLALLALALVVAGLAWAVWTLAETYVSPTAARAWALAATILLPVVGRACYHLGQTEARGKLSGIDAGIDRVTRAAATAIDLRATSASKMRQVTRPDPQVVLLPNPEPVITVRPQITDGEVVDL